MSNKPAATESYYAHLRQVSLAGLLYKRFITSPILFAFARAYGPRLVEIGSGTGSGVLGAFGKRIQGFDVNSLAVDYCKSLGLNAQLIQPDEAFPVNDEVFNACILDNVLEHIADPVHTLNECHRVTKKHGGLVIAVPGICGYASDADHKIFYDYQDLLKLDKRWVLTRCFSMPFFFKSLTLARKVKQYCLVATYTKV
jgi:SAM-dependent methyltransferase